jgi:hypothetical protein
MSTIYIAGPMSNLPGWNHDAFHAEAKKWRDLGYEVLNPAENFDGDTSRPHSDYLRASLAQVLACDEVVALPGWEKSTGAVTEILVAYATGKRVSVSKPPPDSSFHRYDGNAHEHDALLAYRDGILPIAFRTMLDYREDITAEAGHIVSSTRGGDYGHPLDDFTRIAGLWKAYLGFDEIEPEDVAQMMILLKSARARHGRKRDSLVDQAGYAKTSQMITEERKRRGN